MEEGFEVHESKSLNSPDLNKMGVFDKKMRDLQILDVREPEELKIFGYISKQTTVSLGDITKTFSLYEKSQILDKNKPVYVICRLGVRSAIAISYLEKCGFTQLINIKDGVTGLKMSGIADELILTDDFTIERED